MLNFVFRTRESGDRFNWNIPSHILFEITDGVREVYINERDFWNNRPMVEVESFIGLLFLRFQNVRNSGISGCSPFI